MPKVFISYRRSDTKKDAGRIYQSCIQEFSSENVFFDVFSIVGGDDFRDALKENIERSDVVLVLIGQDWVITTDNTGERRLDQPNDYVRMEIRFALAKEDCLVIPILLDNASMPSADDLPDDIRELSFRNAVKVRNDPDFPTDMMKVFDSISAKYPDQAQITSYSNIELYRPTETSKSLTSVQLHTRTPPRNRVFVGRSEIISSILDQADTTRIILLLGISGSGKTTLIQELYWRLNAKDKPVFWYSFNEWSSLDEVFLGLGICIAKFLNKSSQILSFLTNKHIPTAIKVEYLISELNRGAFWLFLDGLEKANDKNIEIFLRESKERLTSGRMVLTSQVDPTFYSILDEHKKLIRTIKLEGFNVSEVEIFFDEMGHSNTEELISNLSENEKPLPILLLLIHSLMDDSGTDTQISTIISKAEDLTAETLFEKVFVSLSIQEQYLLKTASCFLFPTTENHLVEIQNEIYSFDEIKTTLRKLSKRLLIESIEPNYIRVHDLIQKMAIRYVDDIEFFYRKIVNYLTNIVEPEPYDYLQIILLHFQLKDYDTALIYTISIGEDLVRHMPELAFSIFEAFEETSVSDKSQWIHLQILKGRYFQYWEQFDRATEVFLEMLNLASKSNYKDLVAWLMQLLGTLNHDKDLISAKQYYQNSLAIYTELGDKISQAELYTNLGSLDIKTQDFDEASTKLQLAQELKTDANSPDYSLIGIYINLAHLYFTQSDLDRADTYIYRALEIATKEGLQDEISLCEYNLGHHQSKRGNTHEAEDHFLKSLKIAEEYNSWHDKRRAHHALSELYYHQNNYEKAIEQYKSLSLLQDELNDLPELVITYFNIGSLYNSLENHTLGTEYYEKAIKLFNHISVEDKEIDYFLHDVVQLALVSDETSKTILSALKYVKRKFVDIGTSYALAQIYGALGEIYLYSRTMLRVGFDCLKCQIQILKDLNRFDEQTVYMVNLSAHYEAFDRIPECVLISTEAINHLHISADLLPIAYFNRGNAFLKLMAVEKAEHDFSEALKLAKEIDNDQLVESTTHNLGELYRRSGDFSKAIPLLKESVVLSQSISNVRNEISALNNLGLAYKENGQIDLAIDCLNNAIQHSKTYYFKDAEANSLISLGNLYTDKNDFKKALTMYNEALRLSKEINDDNLIEGSVLSVGYIKWMLNEFNDFRDEFERVGQRASLKNHLSNLYEFIKLEAQIALSDGEFEDAADGFVNALALSVHELVDRMADADEAGVTFVDTNYSEIVEIIIIICDWTDDTIAHRTINDAKKFIEYLLNTLSSDWNILLSTVGRPLLALKNYLIELPEISAKEYVFTSLVEDYEDDDSIGQ